MELATIVGIGALVNNAISATKNAREIAKDSTDTDLKEQISTVYDVLLDLKERTLALDEENRQLKAQLFQKAAYTGPLAPYGYYYAAADQSRQHPLCPKCYQIEPKAIAYMGKWDGELHRRICTICNTAVYGR